MAVGALADQMEKPFIKYMEAFLPILVQGLSNNAEYQVRCFYTCDAMPCSGACILLNWARRGAPQMHRNALLARFCRGVVAPVACCSCRP